MRCSHSQINRYETCGQQYEYYYINRLRPFTRSANLSFGSAIHETLADMILDKDEGKLKDAGYYGNHFSKKWEKENEAELEFGRYDNFEKLKNTGQALIEMFYEEELGRIVKVHDVERKMKYKIAGVDFIGYADLVADVANHKGEIVTALIDFKTSGRRYGDEKVLLSDQLTNYMIAAEKVFNLPGGGEVEAAAFCVLLKQKTPKINWHFREGFDRESYEKKVENITADIITGKFFKKPGMHCSWCDFKSVCIGVKDPADELYTELYSGPALLMGEVNELPITFGEGGEWDFDPSVNPQRAVKKYIRYYNIIGEYIFAVTKDFRGSPREYFYKLSRDGKLERLKNYKPDTVDEAEKDEEFYVPF
ncbi:RecB family exonuclease [Halarsenatibacter silvermanii]|uniref:PD-(D/E)XK nuclease superfamily protein n=1 Tax=Halarsenatibacter silvermanii TaxID=321763 RepID=A0A1G9NLF5_9FIRM|nr:PD-(D/E)XK nuclease family protein [Halarsenatibacter silvermanii]SDL87181.1 PD-(D/E)XK nuclease superfamily protein [Halarsenatibacter silvermanii]